MCVKDKATDTLITFTEEQSDAVAAAVNQSNCIQLIYKRLWSPLKAPSVQEHK